MDTSYKLSLSDVHSHNTHTASLHVYHLTWTEISQVLEGDQAGIVSIAISSAIFLGLIDPRSQRHMIKINYTLN